jgi:hypothetical protein
VNYIKNPKNIIIALLIMFVIGSAIFVQKKKTEIETYHRQEIHVLDSIYKYDSVTFAQKYTLLDSVYNVTRRQRDSLYVKDSVNSKTKTVQIRYIYKDSIIEVTVTDHEYVAVTQKTISSLKDSISNGEKKLTELNTEITELKKELTVKKIDTVIVDSTKTVIIEPVDKKFVVYGNVFGKSTQDISLGVGAEVGGEYKILSPMYIGTAIRKDGVSSTDGYNALVKVGVKFEF